MKNSSNELNCQPSVAYSQNMLDSEKEKLQQEERLRRLQCLGLKGYESQGKTAKFQALALPPGVQWEPKYCGSGSLGHGK